MRADSGRSALLNLDLPLLLTVLTIAVCGVFAIHSALHNQAGGMGNVDGAPFLRTRVHCPRALDGSLPCRLTS